MNANYHTDGNTIEVVLVLVLVLGTNGLRPRMPTTVSNGPLEQQVSAGGVYAATH